MLPLSLTSLQWENLDIVHYSCDFQNVDSLICLMNHYFGLELHQSIKTTSCIYPAQFQKPSTWRISLSLTFHEERSRAALLRVYESYTLESHFLGVLPASLDICPKQNFNWPVACLVCLRDGAIVLHVDCMFAQQQRENRIHQDDRCDCSVLTVHI